MNKRLKTIFIFSVLLNLIALCFVAKRIYYTYFRLFNPVITNEERWKNYEDMKSDTGKVILLGTSITQGFPLEGAFKSNSVQNLGFAGSTSNELLKMAPIIAVKKPNKVFIECGINDIRKHIHIDTAFINFVKIISVFKVKSPNTIIYAQSILPTDSTNYNYQVNLYNNRIAYYCKQSGIRYIDLYTHFVRYGQLDKSLTIDGIHLNETGYYVWRTVIEKYID